MMLLSAFRRNPLDHLMTIGIAANLTMTLWFVRSSRIRNDELREGWEQQAELFRAVDEEKLKCSRCGKCMCAICQKMDQA